MRSSAYRRASVGFFACALTSMGCGSSDHPGGTIEIDSGVDSTLVDSGKGDSAVDTTISDTGAKDSSTDSTADARDTAVVDTGPDVPPDGGPAACDPAKDWTAVLDTALTSISTVGADDVLGGVTPDELTIVWVTLVDPNVFLKFADRADKTSAFGAPVTITGTFGFSRIAVSGDGLAIIALDPTRKVLEKLIRAKRGDPFGALTTTGFSNINALTFDGKTRLGDPTLSADGTRLLVGTSGIAFATQLYESTWTGTEWGAPASVVGGWGATSILRPSAFSSDARALFLTDPTDGNGSFAFRPTLVWAFGTNISIGAHAFAAPNAACDKLYFSKQVGTEAGSDLDLYVTK